MLSRWRTYGTGAVVLVALGAMLTVTTAGAAAPASVTPKIRYDSRVLAIVDLQLSEAGKYKVRLKVKWGKSSRRDTTFSFHTSREFYRLCPNSTCVPLEWAFSYDDDSYPTPLTPEFDFMSGGVTAQITMWKAGGPMIFNRTYASYWTKTPNTQIIWQGTDAFVNYCINEVKEIRSSGNRLYCAKIGLGRFKVHPVAR